ncbi:MAG: ribonuclease P protein component [Microthrixaceae bacterium]
MVCRPETQNASVDRVTERAVFAQFRRSRARGRHGSLQVVRLDRPDAGRPAVAYAISRRVGNAVVRNRVRRRLRESARALWAQGELPAATYLVIAGPDAAEAQMTTLRESLRRAAQATAQPAGRGPA